MARMGTKGFAMTDNRIHFEFNTAITAVNPDTGKWDEKAHNETVMPLRALLMQTDGVSGCFIARYGMEVNYLSSVTSRARVIKAAKAAVKEIAGREGFFPLRGRKNPLARPEQPAKRTSDTWWVAHVVFNTDLFVDQDESSRVQLINELTARLVNADGARQPGVGQRQMYIKFDRRQVSPERMEAHLKLVVAELMRNRREKGYFPFAEPVFSYSVHATPYVI